MKDEKNSLFSNVPATNGLARGYSIRPHKRQRNGLRFALVILLLAVAGVVYFQQTASAMTSKEFNELSELADEIAAQRCLFLMEEINNGLTAVYET